MKRLNKIQEEFPIQLKTNNKQSLLQPKKSKSVFVRRLGKTMLRTMIVVVVLKVYCIRSSTVIIFLNIVANSTISTSIKFKQHVKNNLTMTKMTKVIERQSAQRNRITANQDEKFSRQPYQAMAFITRVIQQQKRQLMTLMIHVRVRQQINKLKR